MASWKPWTLTNKGQQFQAKVNAGLVDEVNYTKFAIGDGIASSLESLTELVNKKMDLPLKSVTPQNNTVSFNTLITNTDVEEDFYCREMGLYVTDPDDGEILFAVTTDNNPDLMPADGSATTVAYDFTLVLVFSNTGNVVSFVKMDALATMQDIENHNTNADAHKNLALIINDLLAPTADKNTLVNLLSNVAYMLTQITGKDDWKAGPAASIAAILSNLQGSLAVNWDGNKFTVPALGVSGLMAQNGYVNFGKLVGGLIVQWGLLSPNSQTGILPFNIAFKQAAYVGFLDERTPVTFNWAEFKHSTATKNSVEYSYVSINGIDTDLTNGTQYYDWLWIGR